MGGLQFSITTNSSALYYNHALCRILNLRLTEGVQKERTVFAASAIWAAGPSED